MILAESLIKMGLHPSEILIGYEKGAKKALELLEEMTVYKLEDIRNKDELTKSIKSSLASK